MVKRIDYQRFANSAIKLINKAGSSRQLVKRVQSGDPSRPTITEVQFPCVGVEFDVTTEQVDGKTVLFGDRLAYVAPSLEEEANTGDFYIDKGGVRFYIFKVEKICPDGKVLLWTYWLRK